MPVFVMTARGEEINDAELGVQAIFTRPFNLDRPIEKLTDFLA